MKHLAIIIISLMLALPAYSQRFIGGVIAGGNLTQVDGDWVYGYRKVGVNAGASVMLALNQKQTWFATIELLYTQKGAHKKNLADSMLNVPLNIDESYAYNKKIKYRLQLDYVEIPLVFHYEDYHTGCALGVGVSWGRIVRAIEIENGYKLTTNINSGTYSKSDWSLLADIKFPLYKGLKLNFRFQYSFISIRKRDYFYKNGEVEKGRTQYNNTLTLRLIYTFNDKYQLNDKKNRNGKRIGPKWVRDVNVYQ